MKKAFLASAVALALSAPAYGEVIYTFQTNAGAPANQQATATFDFSDANTLTLTLENIGSVINLDSELTDFHFDLSATPTSVSLGTITDTGGQETCTTSAGPPPHITTCSNDPSTDATGLWTLTPTGFHVDMVANGDPQALHPYAIVNDTFISNAALDGLTNAEHNPVLLGPVDFSISFTGLTGFPSISNVSFSFGTGPIIVSGECTSDNNCQPVQETPEPAILGLMAIAMLAMGFTVRRRIGG